MDISVNELYGYDPKSYRIYDIRDGYYYSLGSVRGAENIPQEELLSDGFLPDTSKKTVIMCADGTASCNTASILRESGIDAYYIRNGYKGVIDHYISSETEDISRQVENSLQKKYRFSLYNRFIRALKEFSLVNAGDRIAVCISGGKDSMLMAKLFQELKKYSDVDFSVEYIVMDPGYNETNRKMIEVNAKKLSVPVKIFNTKIFDSVYNIEKSPCYLCARMRRGHLYNYAKELGCNKIALGHHYDDVIETILMGMLYGGQVQTMMPKLHSTNFEGMELIRPMYYIREKDIKAWRDYNGLRFLQCACRFTDSISPENGNESASKRYEIKMLIRKLKETNPDVENNIFKSVQNVNVDTVITYKKDGIRHNFMDNY